VIVVTLTTVTGDCSYGVAVRSVNVSIIATGDRWLCFLHDFFARKC
jgi:hypothetical protein